MRHRRTASRPTGGLRAITLSAVVANKRALLGAVLVGIVVVMALLSFAWTPFEPNTFDLPNASQAPSASHPAGTDVYGRDILSRIMAGAVTSIGIAVSAVAIALVGGTVIGVFAGYVGGWFDMVATRFIDVMLAIPALVFALGIVALLGPSSRSVTVALAVVYMWPFARVTRTVSVSVRHHSYTEASRGLGVSPGMIVLRDVMPNVLPIMVVQATTALAWGVLDEASLGFLGLGVQPPDPSWGSLLIEGRFYMFDAPWQAITAGFAVLIAVLGINLLGDGLRDIIDPTVTEPAMTTTTRTTVLEVSDLGVTFPGRTVDTRAVDGVSFTMREGEIVGLVGESACGKSTLGLSIMNMVPAPGRIVSGHVLFEGVDLTAMTESQLRQVRGNDISLIVQDALATMNPVTRVQEQVSEIIRDHRGGRGRTLRSRVLDMLTKVHLPNPEQQLSRYPHQLSGGMQQRVSIAQGLILGPRLIIADEPTTALDVTVQAQILTLLRQACEDHGASILFITHDLATVAEICERVLVMYAGRIVESGPVVEVFERPRHPYTAALLKGLLPLDGGRPDRLEALAGQPPRPEEWPQGCRFHPRCPLYQQLGSPAICREQSPVVDESTPHWGACHFTEEVA